jgi:zinc protease
MSRAALVACLAALGCAQTEVRKPSEAAPEDAGARPGSIRAPMPETPLADGGAEASGLVLSDAGTDAFFPLPAPPDVVTTPSNVKLLELPRNQNAIVNVQLRFRSGAVDDPPGKAGLTYLTARVMTEGGTQSLSARQLLEALFPLAAELEVRVDKEMTTFGARVHRDNLAKLLPILNDVILHPRWDPAEFRRLRDMAVNDVEKRLRQGDDENLGKLSLEELLFRDHPYGRITLGHAADLKSMTLQELQAQAARVFTADRLTVGVSGGYPEGLGEKIAQAFSALPKGQPPAAVPLQKPHGPRFLLVEKNADSTAISLGLPWGLSHDDPDWPALSIARSAFGEHRQFNGRLMQRLREARGLNYGDYAYIEYFQQEGGDAATAQTGRARHQQQFSIWLRPVRDDNRLFALRAALYELSRSLKDDPFTPQEVEQTKGFLDGYILLFDQTDARKLGYALDDAFYGRGGFLATWRAALRRVTAEQVNAAWRKWIDPSNLEIAMAGKNMTQVKGMLLSGAPTPIHYQADAQGKTPEKPPAQLATDKQIEAFPFGVKNEGDVQVVPVDQMFE